MASQREFQTTRRKELYANICLLDRCEPLSDQLREHLREGALEKLNQHTFIHLSYYLLTVIDAEQASKLSWPLRDKREEGGYRMNLVNVIAKINVDGLITPVMHSHLVSSGSFKVIRLLYQLSVLALRRLVEEDLKKDDPRVEMLKIISAIKSGEKTVEDLTTATSEITQQLKLKLLKFCKYKQKVLDISKIYKRHIPVLEKQLIDATNLLNNVADSFKDENIATELKNVSKDSTFIREWNNSLDTTLDALVCKWDCNSRIVKAKRCRDLTESLVARWTKKDSDKYTMSYDPETDLFDISSFQESLSDHERSMFKSIVKDGVLIFPNLVRCYMIVMCYAFSNVSVGGYRDHSDVLSQFADGFGIVKDQMQELISKMHNLNEILTEQSDNLNESIEIVKPVVTFPPLPKLTFRRKMNEGCEQVTSLTPLNMTRLHFNLKASLTGNIARAFSTIDVAPKVFLQNTVFQKNMAKVKTDLRELKSNALFSSSKTSLQHDLSCVSTNLNRTSSAFSKQHLMKMLSAQKNTFSTRKKKRAHGQSLLEASRICDRSLFLNETRDKSNLNLYKSVSSPNLVENTDLRIAKDFSRRRTELRPHKLFSIVAETSRELKLNDISGIINFADEQVSFSKSGGKNIVFGLENEPAHSSPVEVVDYQSLNCHDLNVQEKAMFPFIDAKKANIVHSKETANGFQGACGKISTPIRNTVNSNQLTPKNEVETSRKGKTTSIERIIERFNKYRATNAKQESKIKKLDFEEEMSLSDVKIPEVSKLNEFENGNVSLLPDLISPSNYNLNLGRNSSEAAIVKSKRESLGQMLGVDRTFLDEFDIID